MFLSEFTNIPLKSGVWDKNSIEELYSKKQKYAREFKDVLEEFNRSKQELNIINKAKNLEDILSDKTTKTSAFCLKTQTCVELVIGTRGQGFFLESRVYHFGKAIL